MIIPKHDILYKISIFQGLEEYKEVSYPNSIYYHKSGVIYFELEKQILYCNYTLVWNVFSEQSKYNYDETQRIIKDVVERYTNWGTITPGASYCNRTRRWKDILIGGQ